MGRGIHRVRVPKGRGRGSGWRGLRPPSEEGARPPAEAPRAGPNRCQPPTPRRGSQPTGPGTCMGGLGSGIGLEDGELADEGRDVVVLDRPPLSGAPALVRVVPHPDPDLGTGAWVPR